MEQTVTSDIKDGSVVFYYAAGNNRSITILGTEASNSLMNCTTVERISFDLHQIIIGIALGPNNRLQAPFRPEYHAPGIFARVIFNTFSPADDVCDDEAPRDYRLAAFMISLIFFTVVGNTLVILSVIIYQRMRTFTNKLLTSLATADLLVGLFVMPLSLLDLLREHNWPFSMLLCQIWSTSDILFCTASILNLCVISIDRYLAITSPLKYSRTRNRKTAALLLGSVWLISVIVCSPPWIFHVDEFSSTDISAEHISSSLCSEPIVCGYPNVITYRIYSSMASFFIPLFLMFSVYYKIFRVASRREKNLRKNTSVYFRQPYSLSSDNSSCCVNKKNRYTTTAVSKCHSFGDEQQKLSRRQDNDISDDGSISWRYDPLTNGVAPTEKEELTMTERPAAQELLYSVVTVGLTALWPNRYLCELRVKPTVKRENIDDESVLKLSKKTQQYHNRPQPRCLLARAQNHYQTYGPGRIARNSREKMVYLKERKALITIAIVFCAFTICWFPFFVLYLVEVLVSSSDGVIYTTKEVFLWLGYSNSVLNPIIYTMYNYDFRRCFRDLLTFGCLKQRRSMSVRKLHQQKTAC